MLITKVATGKALALNPRFKNARDMIYLRRLPSPPPMNIAIKLIGFKIERAY